MFHLDTYGTLVAATLVLLLGGKCVRSIPLLRKYTIPWTDSFALIRSANDKFETFISLLFRNFVSFVAFDKFLNIVRLCWTFVS